MSFKTTGILLVLVLGLGALWFLAGDKPAAKTGSEAREDKSSIKYVLDPRPEADDVVSFSVLHGDRAIAFERAPGSAGVKPGEWRMTAPLAAATETYQVDSLVQIALGLTAGRTAKLGEGGLTAASAGLEPPVARFSLKSKDGKEYTLDIGKKAQLSNSTYLRVGTQVYLTDRDFTADLKKTADDYRAKSVARMVGKTPVAIRVEHGGVAYEYARGANEEWTIQAPVKAYGDAQKIKAIATSLNGVRVDEFVDASPESLARYGLDAPFLSIEVTAEDAAPTPTGTQPAESQPAPAPQSKFGLLVGGFSDLTETKRFVKLPNEPWVATVRATDVEKLIPKLAEQRDPRIARAKADEIKRVAVSAGDVAFAITRADSGGWQAEGDPAEIDAEAARALVDAFCDAKAIDYVDAPEPLAKYGLDAPRGTISATTATAVEPIELRIGANTPSGRNAYVQRAGQSGVLVITVEQAERLLVTPLALRSREMVRGTPEQVSRVQLTRGELAVELQRTDRAWTVAAPVGAEPDPAGTREIANNLAALRAKRVVAKGDFERYGLANPEAVIEFELLKAPASATSQEAAEPTTIRHVVRVGRADRVPYASIDDDPHVYELDESVFQVLTSEVLRRQVFDFEPSTLMGIRVEAPGGTLEFERRGTTWAYVADSTVKLNDKSMTEFVDQLAKMRAERYVTWTDGDLARARLSDPPARVVLQMERDGQAETITLHLQQEQSGDLPLRAAWVEKGRIFVLRRADVERLLRGLDAYTAPPPKAPPSGLPPGEEEPESEPE